jgi:chromosome segregation ATPase
VSDAASGATTNTPAQLRRLWVNANRRARRLKAERATLQASIEGWQRQIDRSAQEVAKPPAAGIVAAITRARARLDELGEELPVVDEELRRLDAALRKLDEAE